MAVEIYDGTPIPILTSGTLRYVAVDAAGNYVEGSAEYVIAIQAESALPSLSIRPSLTVPVLSSVRTASPIMQVSSIRPSLSLPVCTWVRAGTVIIPVISLQPVLSVFIASSAMVGYSDMPVISMQPELSIPIITGFVGVPSGNAIRAPNGDVLILRFPDGSPITLNFV